MVNIFFYICCITQTLEIIWRQIFILSRTSVRVKYDVRNALRESPKIESSNTTLTPNAHKNLTSKILICLRTLWDWNSYTSKTWTMQQKKNMYAKLVEEFDGAYFLLDIYSKVSPKQDDRKIPLFAVLLQCWKINLWEVLNIN